MPHAACCLRFTAPSPRAVLPPQANHAHSVAFVLRTCSEELALRAEPVVYIADACSTMEMGDAAISASASFRGAPVRTDAIVRLRAACLQVLSAAIGWKAFRCGAGRAALVVGWRGRAACCAQVSLQLPSLCASSSGVLCNASSSAACRDAESVPPKAGAAPTPPAAGGSAGSAEAGGDGSTKLAKLRERLLKARSKGRRGTAGRRCGGCGRGRLSRVQGPTKRRGHR